jgi:lipid A 3-O-deacylase
MKKCLTVLGSLALAAVSAAAGDANRTSPGVASLDTPPPSAGDPWSGGIGEGFRKGTWRSTAEAAASWGDAVFGGKLEHDLALAGVDVGYVLSDVVGQSHWYRGNWEFRTALFGGAQYRPQSAYVAGLTPFLRYDFATGTRWVPFVDAGAGATATDIGHPDLNGTFQFNLQAGGGAHLFLSRRTALTLEYRLLHISNAGMSLPNDSLNTHLVALGVTWFF